MKIEINIKEFLEDIDVRYSSRDNFVRINDVRYTFEECLDISLKLSLIQYDLLNIINGNLKSK